MGLSSTFSGRTRCALLIIPEAAPTLLIIRLAALAELSSILSNTGHALLISVVAAFAAVVAAPGRVQGSTR